MNTNEIIIDDLKYQTYDEYIDSEIEWLGYIPNHFKINRIKNNFKVFNGNSIKEDKKNNFIDNNIGINFIGTKDINNFKINYNSELKIPKQENFKLLEEYTPLLCIEGGSAGKKIAITNQKIHFGNKLCSFNNNSILLKKYMYYYLQSQPFQLQFNNELSGMIEGVSIGIIRNLYNTVISKKEQLAIVKFLDEKTTIIDKKIEILKKQNELEKELEKVLINQCVTKGVDSFTKLDSNENLIDFDNKLNRSKEEFDLYMNENGYKNSEIEWLGYINQNYNITKFKKFFKSNMGNVILKEDLIEDGLYPVYSATAEDKYFGYINDIKLILNKNDLVIPARGNSIGFVKIVKELSTSTQTTIVSKTLNKINSLFIFYFLNVFRKNIFAYDESTIPQFTVEQTNNIIILSPTKQEQLSIVKFLDNKIKQFKLQKDKINKEIELLKEYKKTLINDVVTGKIKVTKD